jgi:hypothetical protein
MLIFILTWARRSSDPTVQAIYGGSITDASGNSWSITAGGQISENGVVDPITQVCDQRSRVKKFKKVQKYKTSLSNLAIPIFSRNFPNSQDFLKTWRFFYANFYWVQYLVSNFFWHFATFRNFCHLEIFPKKLTITCAASPPTGLCSRHSVPAKHQPYLVCKDKHWVDIWKQS